MQDQTKTWECPLCYGEGGHRDRCNARHLTQAPAAPMIHSNGTGYRDLYAQMEAAAQALTAAEKAICEASPNGRDYYTQAPGTMGRAQAEHYRRLEYLAGVKAELEIIWMAISDQERNRGNR